MKRILFSLFTISSLAVAQEPRQNTVPSTGWRRFGDTTAGPSAQNGAPQSTAAPVYDSAPGAANGPSYDQQGPPPPPQQGPQGQMQNQMQNMPPIPAQLTIRPGTYVTVRVDRPLSSDHNQAGDAFSATLVRPIVVDGLVVAQRGQIVGGRVAEAQKAGRVTGTSRLALQLTDLSLVDGQQMPIQAQMVTRTGGTSEGRDAVGIGATTATGAAIGAGVNGGVGAGVGAGIGAVVGITGVLLTRGRPTEVYPETVMTFRIDAPVTISTEHAPYAFHDVQPGEYERGGQDVRMQAGRPAPPPLVRPYYGGYYGPYYGYPYYGYGFGPSIGFGFYSRPYFYGRGYYGGRGFRR